MSERITLAHGNGGRRMRELIDEVFVAALGDLAPDSRCDAAPLPPHDGELMITTDGFTVQPLEFPGGDLGSLAAHGTINDLAVAGARARWLTLSVILEEGLEVGLLASHRRQFCLGRARCRRTCRRRRHQGRSAWPRRRRLFQRDGGRRAPALGHRHRPRG